VLIVNLETGFRTPLLEQILRPLVEAGWADQVVNLLVARFLEFKAITIFSLLFSAGIVMQADRFASPDFSTRIFLSRQLGWLFLLGATHPVSHLERRHPSLAKLALYGVCGMLLLPSLGLRWVSLLAMGAAATGLPGIRPFWTADSNGRLGHG